MQGVLLIGLVPVLLVYRSTAKYSQLATVLLQRVESVTRAPVFANFTETLHGITTIRAFRRQASVTERNERMLNLNDRPYFLKQLAEMSRGWTASAISRPPAVCTELGVGTIIKKI